MTTAPLLIELFTEELPPKALQKLGDAFAQGIHDGLKKSGLIEGEAPVRTFATPRRLGVLLANIRDKAPDRTEVRKLMPAKVAFDAQGQATPALLKRLEKEGLPADSLGKLERRDEGGTETVFASVDLPGAKLADAAQAALLDSIAKLPIPKVMSYQLTDGETTVKFVRPAHGLAALHGSEVLDIEVLGLKAGRTVQGHRFQGGAAIELKDTSEYSQRLDQEGHVIASFEDRRSRIEKLLRERAEETGNSLGPREDYAALLDEVTALVEYPAVYVGSFEAEFLEVPAECLILTMKQNQKYFPLFHADGSLSSRFLIVSNMVLADPANIVLGNERVVRPRLSDARFFFNTDKKTKLADRMAKLASVVYHNKLGTQLERTERVAKLAGAIATLLGADAAKAERAARLAKCDLVTDMVGEFPELQGTMGRYYALHDGEAPEVADAIARHYQPRFSGDALPAHPVSLAVALADKLETLAGLFSIGQEPTGDKDPFALRRHALGVIRMLIEKDLPLSVPDLVKQALSAFPSAQADAGDKLASYVFDRLIGYLRDQGYSALEVDAVVTVRPRWGEFPLRLAAVKSFTALPEAVSLAAANKRVANILKKSAPVADAKPDSARMVESAERELWSALQRTTPMADALFAANDYAGYLKSFAALKAPVDAFFDQVMVNAEDANIRNNRLALLRELRDAMNRVADLSKLAA
ncbi:MAG: glycine--tRNA ligase subunit beta [Betaproteobacteria bacterium]|nr:glycine--tRNA ligase subunit beta [Betaproteobacteria bacterium]